jgi:hypothetical protein
MAGTKHNACRLGIGVEAMRAFENVDFSGDVEIMHSCRDACPHQRFGGLRKRTGAIQDQGNPAQGVLNCRWRIERKHPRLKLQFIPQHGNFGLASASKDWALALVSRLAGDQFSRIAIGAIKHPIHDRFPL